MSDRILKNQREETMSDNPALTEAVYYILLSLCSPRHGYGIIDRKRTRLNSSHNSESRMPSSA